MGLAVGGGPLGGHGADLGVGGAGLSGGGPGGASGGLGGLGGGLGLFPGGADPGLGLGEGGAGLDAVESHQDVAGLHLLALLHLDGLDASAHPGGSPAAGWFPR